MLLLCVVAPAEEDAIGIMDGLDMGIGGPTASGPAGSEGATAGMSTLSGRWGDISVHCMHSLTTLLV